MTEFWTHGGRYDPFELVPTVAAVRAAGRNIVEAESFTGSPAESQWSETPAWLKSIGDAAFCDGVNRHCLHRFTHQPLDERYRPGVVMGQWGTHFDRTQTWWEPGKEWVRYLARCQAVLQWGQIAEARDFSVASSTGDIELRAIHRREANTDVFFVANVARRTGSAVCSFAVKGRQAELWDPVQGTMRDVADFSTGDGRTTIPLEFADSQSFFVVFRKPMPPGGAEWTRRSDPSLREALTLAGPWTVGFDPAWGGPQTVTFTQLTDWTKRPEPGIRYYSGSARYEISFDRPDGLGEATPAWLDLGTVGDLAQVRLNGRDLGVVWTAPWRVELTGLLQNRGNQLEIVVTNTWANRLIGDEQEPPDLEWGKGDHGFGGPLKRYPQWLLRREQRPSAGRYTFATWNYFQKDSPLRSSGLLGPVRIAAQAEP